MILEIVEKIEVHPRYILPNSFRDCNGKTERAITYKSDFRLTYADGTIEVVEVKSKRTAKEPDYIRQAQRAGLMRSKNCSKFCRVEP